jgi:tRNA threonylcarbamoyladenosine biosynthesis protein TsaE
MAPRAGGPPAGAGHAGGTARAAQAGDAVSLALPSLAATRAAGLALGRALPPRALVLCAGPLGAGKTTLLKAVCEGLGIAPQLVTSPTYTLVNVYPGPRSVYHVDLYRLETPEALLELDRDDWVHPDGVTLIEWPQHARPLLVGEALLELALEPVPAAPEARRLTARATGESAAGASARYAAAIAALRELAAAGGTPPPSH